MAKKTARKLADLPPLRDTFLFMSARLRTWITPPDAPPERPYAGFVASAETGMVRAMNLYPVEPNPVEARDLLVQAMRKPGPETGGAGRPDAIAVVNPALAEPLQVLLQEAGLGISVFPVTPPPELGEMVRSLEEHLRGGAPELPGLLASPGVTPELAGEFFAAATEFYRAAPWVQLSNFNVLAIRHPEEREDRYAIVMGQGGVEYGLAGYAQWEDVEALFTDDELAEERIPEGGMHSLFYDQITSVPFDDLDAIQAHGWPIPSEDAYPIAVVAGRDQAPARPSLQELQWYVLALRVIPVVAEKYLEPDGEGDYKPFEVTVRVQGYDGPADVRVTYDPDRLDLGERPADEADWMEEEELPFDRRQMEAMMQNLLREQAGEPEGGDPKLREAQELMYQAWDERNPAKRIALAHDALVLSADCADAYVLLAEEESPTLRDALVYWQDGVAAGERALGPEYFRDNAGHFWGLLETRGYMRARIGLASTLWRLNRKEESLEHYRELLRLNPSDNQGVRYILVDLLLGLDRVDEVGALLAKYPDDWSAVMKYTKALLAFRQGGATDKAGRALNKALEQNQFVPDYLTGKKRVPAKRPGSMGMGDEREAIDYVSDHLNYWRRTPGAVEWLETQLAGKQQRARKVPQKSVKAKKAIAPKKAKPEPKRTPRSKKRRRL